MALTGNWTKVWYTPHETETEEVQLTRPDGTTETETFPVSVRNTTEYTNVYVVLDWCFHYKFNNDDLSNTLLDFGYRVYESESARNSAPETYLESGDMIGNYISIASGDDVRVKAYEIMKAKDGFTNLTDD